MPSKGIKLSSQQRGLLAALSDLIYCNPFEPVRIELERSVLGDQYAPEPLGAWSRTEATHRNERPNIVKINALAAQLVETLHAKQAKASGFTGKDALLYDDLVTYNLYYRHVAVLKPTELGDQRRLQKAWRGLQEDREKLLAPLGADDRQTLPATPHLFACLHQVRRAFNAIFDCLIGQSAPATRLRAAVWQSIFTHDLRRYRRVLYQRMADLSTLVTGPSGAGKELVARAIGHSQYRPFDPETEGFRGAEESFIALNLSALSPTLIESELFGHRKGAFTGAATDRTGWLERCPAHGAVFLDEIGELDPAIQVKLLRVAQSRDYSRLGESKPRRFVGKLLAATNRDLAAEMRSGRFREDLYYRLCSDQVAVPTLRAQLDDSPAALSGLVRFLARRVLGEPTGVSTESRAQADTEVESLVADVEQWISHRLPSDYSWPGNIRELEQCVRSVLVRCEYHPPAANDPAQPTRPDWLTQAEQGQLTADALLTAYCRHLHRQQGGYEQAARVLGLDRRTVKSRVTQED